MTRDIITAFSNLETAQSEFDAAWDRLEQAKAEVRPYTDKLGLTAPQKPGKGQPSTTYGKILDRIKALPPGTQFRSRDYREGGGSTAFRQLQLSGFILREGYGIYRRTEKVEQ